MFCSNCGARIDDHSKFCNNCGARVVPGSASSGMNHSGGFSQNAENYNSSCPGCGAAVNSFSTKCPRCGRELYTQVRATACQQLCDRLAALEYLRPKDTLLSKMSSLIENKIDSINIKLNRTDLQKIELISTFVVPNTKVELIEFLLLADSKIKYCEQMKASADDRYTREASDKIGRAWHTKYYQTLEKAKLTLNGDPDFEVIYRAYVTQTYRQQGLCQYCGGRFKGLFKIVCAQCGRQKDY